MKNVGDRSYVEIMNLRSQAMQIHPSLLSRSAIEEIIGSGFLLDRTLEARHNLVTVAGILREAKIPKATIRQTLEVLAADEAWYRLTTHVDTKLLIKLTTTSVQCRVLKPYFGLTRRGNRLTLAVIARNLGYSQVSVINHLLNGLKIIERSLVQQALRSKVTRTVSANLPAGIKRAVRCALYSELSAGQKTEPVLLLIREFRDEFLFAVPRTFRGIRESFDQVWSGKSVQDRYQNALILF